MEIITVIFILFALFGSFSSKSKAPNVGAKRTKEIIDKLSDRAKDMNRGEQTAEYEHPYDTADAVANNDKWDEWDENESYGFEPEQANETPPNIYDSQYESIQTETYDAARAYAAQTELIDDYDTEEAFGEDGMLGGTAQGRDDLQNIRVIKKDKEPAGRSSTQQQQLRNALGDLPSAIVAAEILGKPRALRRSIR